MENQFTPLTYPEKNANSAFSSITAAHVAIRTSHYSELINWYTEKLDFRIVREWMAGEMRLAFIAPPNDNGFIIEILGHSNVVGPNTAEVKWGYDHLCFNVADLDKTIETLTSRDITIVREFSVPAIGKRIVFIADPFGNRIEFFEDIKVTL